MDNRSAKDVWTRRDFIKISASFALGHVALPRALAQTATNRRVLAYLGSYTSAVDGGSNGKGIYRFEVDSRTGAFTGQKLVAETPNPSWIAIHPSKKHLYSVNEVINQESGSVRAFAIDPASGDLTPLNSVSSEGRGPAHMSLDASGKYAFVANYAGGTIAVLPILEGVRLAAAVDFHRDAGSVRARPANDATREFCNQRT
jgi:6-phosphogluconolactonase